MSIFSPTIFPDEVTVTYDTSGKLSAYQHVYFEAAITVPAHGTA